MQIEVPRDRMDKKDLGSFIRPIMLSNVDLDKERGRLASV